MFASPLTFWILAAVVLLSALAMVLSQNLMHSAFWLILVFIGVAGVYILLEADFLAIVQLLIYAGTIGVLFVFGVMLTKQENIARSNPFNNYKIGALLIAFFLFLSLGTLFDSSVFKATSPAPLAVSTTGSIAELLFGPFLVPVEISALILMVAIVGAVILARGVDKS